MKFTCEKSDLCEAVGIAQRAVSSHSTIRELEGLLIIAEGGQVCLTGYNLEIGIEARFKADVVEDGTVVLNSRIFGDIARKLPEGGRVEIECGSDNTASIRCLRSEYTNISGISPEGFPEMPVVESENSLSIPAPMLKNMVKMTMYAASTNENKPIHTGELFELKDGMLTVVAVDGFRLALRREKLDGEDRSFVVPAKALAEVIRVLPDDDDETAKITLTRKYISFEIGETTITSRLLEGEFLNYDSAIPKSSKVFATVDVKEFTECVERASLIIEEKLKSPVRLRFADGQLKLECNSTLGSIDESFPIELEGGEIEIGFNNRYLLDALKACEEEKVRLEMTSGLSPCIVRPEKGDSFTYLVLPVRLKNA